VIAGQDYGSGFKIEFRQQRANELRDNGISFALLRDPARANLVGDEIFVKSEAVSSNDTANTSPASSGLLGFTIRRAHQHRVCEIVIEARPARKSSTTLKRKPAASTAAVVAESNGPTLEESVRVVFANVTE